MAFPIATNMTSYTEIFEYANTVSGGWFFPLMLVSVWITITLSLISYNLKTATAVSSIITVVLSFFMSALGFIPAFWSFIFVVVMALNALWLYFD